MAARGGTPNIVEKGTNNEMGLLAEIQITELLHIPKSKAISPGRNYSTSRWVPRDLPEKGFPPRRILVASKEFEPSHMERGNPSPDP